MTQESGEQILAQLKEVLACQTPDSINWEAQARVLEEAILQISDAITPFWTLRNLSDEEWQRTFGERSFEIAIIVQAITGEVFAARSHALEIMGGNMVLEIRTANRRVRRFAPH